ncbi:hypothetical protein [Domibacillus enclensis]|uniref:Uncharacterized protein n=1 Tax=Domibacillus enclensis TaxID=1017273 RepID=A0A1N6XYJ5_9BACI|nr:hypothetical protein [Domibacillus enclensis]OXS77460.1 hypothetical protein B1B05_11530 [Domibacillus enclensis]SIR07398.1 hypothetical protein SAMN05443094_10593 [Domibacillus enclensis]
MRPLFSFFLISLAAIVLFGCSDDAHLNQLTRIDIQELNADSDNPLMITEETELERVQQVFQHIDWQPNTLVDIKGEKMIEATFFYQEEEQLPERLSVYDVYLMENGKVAIQSDRSEEGFGELSNEQAEAAQRTFLYTKMTGKSALPVISIYILAENSLYKDHVNDGPSCHR